MSNSHSGTIGRNRGLAFGSSQMRRQRSVEWSHERAGYSSSDDDERMARNSIGPTVDSNFLATLIAQTQQLRKLLPESGRPYDCDTDDVINSPNTANRQSPLQLRQASPFPHEATNSRRKHYATPHERLRSNGELLFSNSSKAILLPGGAIRSSRGMTSSSSATSSVSNHNERSAQQERDIPESVMKSTNSKQHITEDLDARNDEPPPEPAPPEVPPRGHSLLQSMSSMRKRSDYQIHIQENNCDQKHEEFIPQEKQQGEFGLSFIPFAVGRNM
ncbi:uncharacterized protein LOC132262532 [Phlebotomus argentipes]|uniref:uncharacterized protein LOC132262532 n=1 Tax=Phlebotomus argentipes TaxID=94469 RepID=UPI002892E7D2|nr:uncharacterized protein LOC132262532 [Phlebotomus argentipes]